MNLARYFKVATLALLVSAGAASAQEEWEFGIKGGMALNMMPHTTIDAGDKFKVNIGFQGGGYACMYITDMAMVQAELLYTRKGVTTINHVGEYAVGGAALQYTRNIHYLQIPVLAGFHSLMDDRIKLMLGPELGIYLADNIKTNYDSPSYNTTVCNPLNLGFALQATYYIIDALGFDVKFDYGLTRTFKKSQVEILPDDKGHNAAVQFGLCYRFGY